MMKKTFIALLLGAVSVGAVAQQGGFVAPNSAGTTSGGFKGPVPGLTTVEQAKTLRDDADRAIQQKADAYGARYYTITLKQEHALTNMWTSRAVLYR